MNFNADRGFQQIISETSSYKLKTKKSGENFSHLHGSFPPLIFNDSPKLSVISELDYIFSKI